MIERYTDEGHPYRLILSLTSAFDEKRARLMPIGRALRRAPSWRAAMRRHAAARGGPVHLAWVLMAGVNTGAEEARELGRLFARRAACGCRSSTSTTPTGRFRARGRRRARPLPLARSPTTGIGFVRRYSGGPDIHAACGMLASQRAPAGRRCR